MLLESETGFLQLHRHFTISIQIKYSEYSTELSSGGIEYIYMQNEQVDFKPNEKNANWLLNLDGMYS